MPDVPERPNIARVYDALLEGTHNLAVDRAQAALMEKNAPGFADKVRGGRAFLGRAVTWTARQKVDQYIDLGAGLPAPSRYAPVHEAAAAVMPSSRVLYVDADATAVDFGRAWLDRNNRAAMIQADLKDPDAVLGSAERRQLIDLARPVCVVVSMVLHFIPPAESVAVVRGYTRHLAPGSYVIISAGYADPAEYARMQAAYKAARLHCHTQATWDAWLEGLAVMPPGLADVRGLIPGAPLPALPRRSHGILGVIARVPAGYQPPS